MIKEPSLCDICAKNDKCPDSTNNAPWIMRVFCSRFEDVDNEENE